MLQWPIAMMTALPLSLISAQSLGSSSANPPAFNLKTVVTLGMFFLNQIEIWFKNVSAPGNPSETS
jgi:hypothetical protein